MKEVMFYTNQMQNKIGTLLLTIHKLASGSYTKNSKL